MSCSRWCSSRSRPGPCSPGPALVAHGIDAGLQAKDEAALDLSAGLYLAVAVAGLLFGRLALWVVANVGEPFLRDLRIRVFRHLMALDLGFFEREQTGRLVARLTSDVDAIQDLVQLGLAQFVQNVFLFFGAVIVILIMSWKLALCVLIVVPPVYFGSRWFRRESSRAFLEVRDRIGTNLATLQEGLAGVRVVQAFGRERGFARRFRETNEAQYDANLETVRISTRYFPLVEFCGVAGIAVIIGIGGLFADQGIVTVGVVAAFVLYLNNLFEPVQQLSQLYNTLQQAGAAVKKLLGLLDAEAQHRRTTRRGGPPLRRGARGRRRVVPVRRRAPRPPRRVDHRRLRGAPRAGRPDRRREVHPRQAHVPVL